MRICYIDERVYLRAAQDFVAWRGRVLTCRVDADAVLATGHAEQAAIVHRVEQMSGRVRRAAPVVAHRAVGEMIICLARMHTAAFANELEQRFRLLPALGGPTDARRIFILLSGLGHRRQPRMHQRMYRASHEAVVDEEIFLDAELRVAAFEIAGAIILDAMAQYQVLSAGWRANRIGLHKAEPVQRAFQRGGREEALRDGQTAQIVESDRHDRVNQEPNPLTPFPQQGRGNREIYFFTSLGDRKSGALIIPSLRTSLFLAH